MSRLSSKSDDGFDGARAAGETAMRAAVELEIASCLGSATTLYIGQQIQKAIDDCHHDLVEALKVAQRIAVASSNLANSDPRWAQIADAIEKAGG